MSSDRSKLDTIRILLQVLESQVMAIAGRPALGGGWPAGYRRLIFALPGLPGLGRLAADRAFFLGRGL